jgi:hypothetical protein
MLSVVSDCDCPPGRSGGASVANYLSAIEQEGERTAIIGSIACVNIALPDVSPIVRLAALVRYLEPASCPAALGALYRIAVTGIP